MTDIPGPDEPPESIDTKKTASDALKKALDLLSRREHAIAELQLKLLKRGFEDTVIDGVLAYLVDKNYLNDARFAEAFVRMRSSKGFGERDIQARLRERKITSPDMVAAFAAEAPDWFELAEQVLDKKFRGDFQRGNSQRDNSQQDNNQRDNNQRDNNQRDNNQRDNSQRERAARYLQSRGFTAEQTFHAIDVAAQTNNLN